MSTKNHLAQNEIILTRRAALRTLAASAIAILALSTNPNALASEVEISPGRPPAWPDPARTAVIDKWRHELDRAITTLENLWGFLGEARALPPNQVDRVRFLELESVVLEELDRLPPALKSTDFSELASALTGQSSNGES